MNHPEEHGPPDGEGERNPRDADRRVQSIIEAFVEQQRTGQAPDPDEIIVAHPEVAAELEQRLAAAVLLHQLAQSRHTAPGPTGVTPAVLPATIGRYRILGLRGVGASAVVYHAFDPKHDREVALKVIRAVPGLSGESVERFVRDARSLARLRHPYIVPFHEAGQYEEWLTLDMELVRGETLEARLARPPALSLRESALLVSQLAAALQYAHDNGVVHRDVKPSNILIDERGEPLLADFSLARRSGDDQTLTTSGQLLGSPVYMSPEQAEGRAHTADGRSDTYSLGVVLYRLLTGQLPFKNDPDAAITDLLQRIVRDEPPRLRSHRPDLPPDLETICLKALEKRPEDRFVSAGAFGEELRRWLNDEPLTVRPPSSWEKVRRWARRNRVAARVAGVMAVLILLSLTLGWAAWNQRTRATLAEERAELARTRQTLQDDVHAQLEAQALLDRARLRLRAPTQGRRIETQRILTDLAGPRRRILSVDVIEAIDREARSVFVRTLALPDIQTTDSLDLPHLGMGFWPVAMRPDGAGLAIGTARGPLYWPRGLKPVVPTNLEKHRAPAQLRYSPDSKYLAFAPSEGGLQVWDSTAARRLGVPLPPDAGRVVGIGFDPKARTVLACLTSGRVRSWTLPEIREGPAWEAEGSRAAAWTAARFDLEAGTLAAGDESGRVILFSRSGAAPLTLADPANRTAVRSLAWSTNGRLLAVGTKDGSVQLWQRDGTRLRRLTDLVRDVVALEFVGPDGRWLLASTVEQGFRLWDVTTGELLLMGGGVFGGVSRDGQQLALGFANTVAWGNLLPPVAVQVLRGHSSPVEQVAWSGDGRRLATLDTRFEVRVWDVASGSLVDTFRAPLGGFYSQNAALALDRGGRRLAYASGGEGEARALIRDVVARRPLAEWSLPGGFEHLAADGNRFLLVREEFDPGRETVRSVLRHLEVGRTPDVVRVLRPSAASDQRRYFNSQLTPNGRFYRWAGPREPRTAPRVEVFNVSTGRRVTVVAAVPEPGLPYTEPYSYLDPAGRFLWLLRDQKASVLRYDLSGKRPPDAAAAVPISMTSDGGWQLYNGPSLGDPSGNWALVEGQHGRCWLDVANHDGPPLLQMAFTTLFSPDDRFLCWGSGSGNVTVADLPALRREIEAFEKR